MWAVLWGSFAGCSSRSLFLQLLSIHPSELFQAFPNFFAFAHALTSASNIFLLLLYLYTPTPFLDVSFQLSASMEPLPKPPEWLSFPFPFLVSCSLLPFSLLWTLPVMPHLIPTTTVWGKYYFPSYTNEKTEAQVHSITLFKVIDQLSQKSRFELRQSNSRAQMFNTSPTVHSQHALPWACWMNE